MIRTITRRCDLSRPIKMLDYVPIGAFYADSECHDWRVEVYNGLEPENVSGTVSGYAVLPDNSTVVLTGTSSGNVASIIFPPTLYSQVGSLKLVMVVASGDEKLTLDAFYTYVESGQTGTIVDPGTVIPSVADLIADIEEAVETIPPVANALMAAMAPTFDPDEPYTAGQFVWYDGALKMFIVDHPVGSWNSAHVTDGVIADHLLTFTDNDGDITITMG